MNSIKYLLAPFLAWVLAQGLKHIVHWLGHNRRIFSENPRSTLLLSGGMPSGHSAIVSSLASIIGFTEGFMSPMFALGVGVAVIVMYDATMVRYSSGQQGDTLNQLLREQRSKIPQLRVAHGHTVLEVTVGVVLGIGVAIVVFFAT